MARRPVQRKRRATGETASVGRMAAPAPTPPVDPRVRTARRIVIGIGVMVALIMAGTVVLAGYYFATERPAREMFFEPEEAPPPTDTPPL